MCQNTISILSATSRKDNVKTIPVPCGRCAECVKAKLSAWLFRFEVELRQSSNPLFITLTYAPEFVPYGGDGTMCALTREASGHKTLWPKDLQDFIKRLRFHHAKKSKKKLVFYGVGEYGTSSLRPHYHLILLNLDATDQRVIKGAKGKDIVINPLVDMCWHLGFNYTLPLEEGGINYVLKYVYKPKIQPYGTQKMFARMSKGIGECYLTKARQEFHLQGPEFAYHRLDSGAKIPLIRYFKRKLFTDEQYRSVSEYLEYMSRRNAQRKIERFAIRNRVSEEKAENILEYRKKSVKLPHETRKAGQL